METYLTKKELAEKFKISESTINRLMRNGLKFYKFGNTRRFLEKDMLDYFEVIQKGRKK